MAVTRLIYSLQMSYVWLKYTKAFVEFDQYTSIKTSANKNDTWEKKILHHHCSEIIQIFKEITAARQESDSCRKHY